MSDTIKKFSAEALGTFLLVLMGCGVAIIAGSSVGLLGVTISFGLTLMTLVYTLGPISGCHLNPAVSLGMLITTKLSLSDFIGYVFSQLAGACLAGATLYLIQIGDMDFNLSESGLAANIYGKHSPLNYTIASALIVETLGTFFLVFTILNTTKLTFPKGFEGIVIGFALMVGLLLAGNITNGSLNPARSMGVAFFQGGSALKQVWFFILVPCLGATLAASLYRCFND